MIQSSHSERVKKICLKPAFNIDHFLCNGFTGMPTLIRTSILDEAEPCWSLESADAVSESLVLQGLRQSSKVLHIPDILSTRRCLSGHGNPARLPPLETEKKLRELGFKDASVRPSDNPAIYRIRFSKESSGKTAIIIPTKNNVGLLRQTIESIQKTTPAELYSLVVVDHESDDPACVSYLQSLSEKHLVLPYEGLLTSRRLTTSLSRISTQTMKQFCSSTTILRPFREAGLRACGIKPDVRMLGR